MSTDAPSTAPLRRPAGRALRSSSPAGAPALQEPLDPTPPPIAGGAVTGAARLPIWVLALLVFAVLGGFGWMVFEAWRFVLHATGPNKQQQWEQLRNLIDLANAVVLLTLGTVLGVAVQGRQSAQLAGALREQARAAVDLHQVAQRNAAAARQNAAAATTAGAQADETAVQLRRAAEVLDQVRILVASRDAAQTQFVAARSLHPARQDGEAGTEQLRLDPAGPTTIAVVADPGVDRTLTRIGDRAEAVLTQIQSLLGERL